ncbi:hypothetical protein FPRO06_12680 [Fusarium proliferatum]|nr:hypothetical protein FPRO06_12680 [Fusarium proliferatum]
MPSITAVTIFIFGLSAFNHGVSNLISPRKALAAKQLQDSALPALNGFSVAIIGIGIYYMLAAYQENRGFFTLTLARFISARIFWLQGPAWRVIATWEAFSAALTAVALAYEEYQGIKRFYVEVQDIFRRLPNNYHVDIKLVKNYGFWPTWYIAKRPTSRYIDKVTSSIRIFEPTDDLDDRFKDSLSFSGGDAGPGGAVWAIYELLVSLIQHEPGYLGLQNNQRFVINEVEVNVVAPTDGAAHTKLSCGDNDNPWWLRWSCIECAKDLVPEERLANFMTSHLDAVFSKVSPFSSTDRSGRRGE